MTFVPRSTIKVFSSEHRSRVYPIGVRNLQPHKLLSYLASDCLSFLAISLCSFSSATSDTDRPLLSLYLRCAPFVKQDIYNLQVPFYCNLVKRYALIIQLPMIITLILLQLLQVQTSSLSPCSSKRWTTPRFPCSAAGIKASVPLTTVPRVSNKSTMSSDV